MTALAARDLLVAVSLALASSAAHAQRIRVDPHLALRVPLSGSLVVQVPLSSTTGFSSVPERFRETAGLTAGLRMDIPVIESIAIATGASIELAGRTTDSDRFDVGCWQGCLSALAAVELGLAGRIGALGGTPIRVMVGGTMIHLFGEAYADPLFLGGQSLLASRRLVGGAVASLGGSRRLASGGTLRVDVSYRRYGVRYEWETPIWATIFGGPESSAFMDLRLMLGWRR